MDRFSPLKFPVTITDLSLTSNDSLRYDGIEGELRYNEPSLV